MDSKEAASFEESKEMNGIIMHEFLCFLGSLGINVSRTDLAQKVDLSDAKEAASSKALLIAKVSALKMLHRTGKRSWIFLLCSLNKSQSNF